MARVSRDGSSISFFCTRKIQSKRHHHAGSIMINRWGCYKNHSSQGQRLLPQQWHCRRAMYQLLRVGYAYLFRSFALPKRSLVLQPPQPILSPFTFLLSQHTIRPPEHRKVFSSWSIAVNSLHTYFCSLLLPLKLASTHACFQRNDEAVVVPHCVLLLAFVGLGRRARCPDHSARSPSWRARLRQHDGKLPIFGRRLRV